MTQPNNLPKLCPSCGCRLYVRTMHCDECNTHIEGSYRLPLIMQLPENDQRFILDFILSGGSLKQIAAKMGMSYPTVRNRLDDIISELNNMMLNDQK